MYMHVHVHVYACTCKFLFVGSLLKDRSVQVCIIYIPKVQRSHVIGRAEASPPSRANQHAWYIIYIDVCPVMLFYNLPLHAHTILCHVFTPGCLIIICSVCSHSLRLFFAQEYIHELCFIIEDQA